jgi:hypothetical protein
MIEPILFDLPREEDPEPGLSDSITHGCDYMMEPDGSVMFHYNFLIYVWTVGDEVITGRAYLDTAQRIDIFVSNHRLRGDAAFQPLVRYLQRRFLHIGTFHADDVGLSETGYTAAFRHRDAPVPN